MKKYELCFGTIHNCFEIETSEEYNSLEKALKEFKHEKETLNKNSSYKSICLIENVYENNEIIESKLIKEFTIK